MANFMKHGPDCFQHISSQQVLRWHQEHATDQRPGHELCTGWAFQHSSVWLPHHVSTQWALPHVCQEIQWTGQ